MKNTLNIFIALIWLINGLFCKVLNLIPRHREIVSEITNSKYSKEITIMIGVLEILMFFWIICKIHPKLNASIQIGIIALMNIIEFIMVPHLLLWGRLNSVFALLLILIIYLTNYHLNNPFKTKHHAFNS
ncbi:DoxX-like family protein [uncultured Algibacter sp.]|uniref:DoxX-like family protein n=1 Tax=uncultured Algibacter sp. TaxID=298659 RepID=UPI002611BD7F|nr:DoxX-like family protein [uncultured Algibacter sp.]